jgi:acyl carrier protein
LFPILAGAESESFGRAIWVACYPAEVEFVLRDQPEIDDCVVMAKNGAEDKQLVAYLTNRTGNKPDGSTLRTRLAEKLPEYMLPTRFVWLDELPLTNGKIDRKALEESESVALTANDYVAPQNKLERQLVEIWRTVLRQDRVGIRDNFVELGGHSLSAARVAMEIDKLLGCNLPISTLFRLPTIESLARYLTQGDSAPPFSSLVPLQPVGSKPPLFIVHGWGGDVYFFHELAKLLPNQPAYGLQAVGLDGKVPRHVSVEEMAAHYVKEIRVFQPEGPYFLVGYSLGSLIAFEMGRQLYQLGQSVAFLGLLDPPIRPAPWLAYARTVAPLLWQSARFHLRQSLRTSGRESLHLKRR